MPPCVFPGACAALDGLPPDLRDAARSLMARFADDRESWDLSVEEIVAAITAPSFRPVLEQEARLNALSPNAPS